jgi:hypothetical protein
VIDRTWIPAGAGLLVVAALLGSTGCGGDDAVGQTDDEEGKGGALVVSTNVGLP